MHLQDASSIDCTYNDSFSLFQGNTEKPESLQLSEEDDTSNTDDRSIDKLVQSTVPEVFESTDTSEEKIEDSCPASLHDEVVQDDIVKFTSRTTKHGNFFWVKVYTSCILIISYQYLTPFALCFYNEMTKKYKVLEFPKHLYIFLKY